MQRTLSSLEAHKNPIVRLPTHTHPAGGGRGRSNKRPSTHQQSLRAGWVVRCSRVAAALRFARRARLVLKVNSGEVACFAGPGSRCWPSTDAVPVAKSVFRCSRTAVKGCVRLHTCSWDRGAWTCEGRLADPPALRHGRAHGGLNRVCASLRQTQRPGGEMGGACRASNTRRVCNVVLPAEIGCLGLRRKGRREELLMAAVCNSRLLHLSHRRIRRVKE